MKAYSSERFMELFMFGVRRPKSRKRYRHWKRQRWRRTETEFAALEPITTIASAPR